MRKTEGMHKFILFDGTNIALSGTGGEKILLYPFRKISVHAFSFPFSGVSRVSEALRIQYRPLLGEGTSDVAIIPFFAKSEKKSSRGAVFMLFGEETRYIEENVVGNRDDYAIWPAALAFAGEVDGNGLIVWTDELSVTTVWVEDWVPLFYKSVDADKTTEADEERLALEYIHQQGKSVERVFLLDKKDLLKSDIQAYGSRTLAKYPAYEQLDISNRGANLLVRREEAISGLTRFGRAAIATGLLMCLGAGFVYLNNSDLADTAQPALEDIYAAGFGERSRQPLSSALAKLRSMGALEADNSLYAMMRGVTTVWDKLGVSADITIDTMRYGTETTDVVGTAKTNEAIARLRTLLVEEGYSTRTDNIQTIPGGDLRFNMTITGGGDNR